MIFSNLTVAENLAMGAYLQKDKAAIARNREYVFGIFPRLKERLRQTAGTLSGGEQQMLAIGRALMGDPKVPDARRALARDSAAAHQHDLREDRRDQPRPGIAILLVEQNANLALEISAYAYVLETGQLSMDGASADLRKNPQLKAAYLGG
jgi:branched-chain amino acid transport system ATP-binding protein